MITTITSPNSFPSCSKTLTTHFTHKPFHQNPFTSLKLISNPQITLPHIKSTHPNKPFSVGPTTPPQKTNTTTLCCSSSTTWGGSFFSKSGRPDFRVGSSSRRAGSKKKTGRIVVTLECSECMKNRYTSEKRRLNVGKVGSPIMEKLELNKYCPHCRKHKIHKEIKK